MKGNPSQDIAVMNQQKLLSPFLYKIYAYSGVKGEEYPLVTII